MLSISYGLIESIFIKQIIVVVPLIFTLCVQENVAPFRQNFYEFFFEDMLFEVNPL